MAGKAAELQVELAVRGPQPAMRDRRVWVLRSVEHDLLAIGRKKSDTTKMSVSVVDDDTNSFAAAGPVISSGAFERPGLEAQSVAEGLIVERAVWPVRRGSSSCSG